MFAEAIRVGGPIVAAPASRTSFARAALSAAVLAGATLAAPVHAAAPATVELQGEVHVLMEDHAKAGQLRYFLKSGRSMQEFRPTPSQERRLKTGAQVRVRGFRSGTILALDGTTTSMTTVAPAPLANTLGDRKLAVVLVNFQDNITQPFTVAAANTAIGQVNTYIRENSLNQASVSGSAVGWLTLPIASSCSLPTISTAAKTAAAGAGIDLSAYQHIAYVFPKNTACTWAGSAYVGGKEMLINGTLELKVLGHEYSHNLGLYHSHGLECGSAINTGTCSGLEYGDQLDIMGTGQAAQFNSFQKERLGWLNNGSMPPITTVTGSGDYSLTPYEAATGGARALKIRKGTDATTGAATWYYVEFRQATGADAFLATLSGGNITTGVVIRTGTEGNGNSSYLLDMTPASSILYEWNDAALVLGRSFTDATAGVTITPTVLGSSGATVNVSLAATTTAPVATCTRANPVITPASQSQTGVAGGTLSYTVTVSNPDSSACSASNFTLGLGTVLPSGWSASFGNTTLTVSPGSSASTTLTLSAPAGATTGATASLRATNAAATGYAGTASATYGLNTTMATTSYSVSAATDKSLYSANSNVVMTAVVMNGTTGVSGAGVTFRLTTADGSVVLQNASTGNNGVATSTYRLPRKAAKGSYQLKTSVSGQTATGSASFSVQ